jgi:hypothetical protein
VVLPANNIFGLNHLCTPEPPVDAGCVVFPTVDAGYYLMVRPLSVGGHKIRFTGSAAFGTVAVKYTITVAGPRNMPDD